MTHDCVCQIVFLYVLCILYILLCISYVKIKRYIKSDDQVLIPSIQALRSIAAD